MSAKQYDAIPRMREGMQLTARQINGIAGALIAGRPQLGFECSGPLCICSGDPDCNDMFGSGICGDGICFENDAGQVVCLCWR